MNKLFPSTVYSKVVFVWGANRWWQLVCKSKDEAKKIYGDKACICVAKNCVELFRWYTRETMK